MTHVVLRLLTWTRRYSRNLFAASALQGDGWSAPRPSRFTPGEDPLHSAGGRVGLEAGLDGHGKSPPHRDYIQHLNCSKSTLSRLPIITKG
jgi:hypothetical protein